LGKIYILVAKSFFFSTLHPDPLPKGRGELRKELLAIAINLGKS
jgi:hypothetical protein